jgi:hypothetical protein
LSWERRAGTTCSLMSTSSLTNFKPITSSCSRPYRMVTITWANGENRLK